MHDQYLEFVTLEDNMFSSTQKSIYLQLNDPSAGDREIEDQKLRDHLLSMNNLFTEGGRGFMSSFQRPLLCIFDRNFELSVGIQHDFRYRPLVHDVLGLKLNTLILPDEKKETFVDSSDPFWSTNSSLEFPEVAEQIETQLNKYKKDVEGINRRTGRWERYCRV